MLLVLDYGRNNTVIYKGYLYTTIEDIPVDGTQNTCQSGYLSLPTGWTIADESTNSIAVTAAHYWSTNGLVFSNGKVYRTLMGPSCCSQTAGAYCCSGYLLQSGSTYSVTSCSVQILITSNINLYIISHI